MSVVYKRYVVVSEPTKKNDSSAAKRGYYSQSAKQVFSDDSRLAYLFLTETAAKRRMVRLNVGVNKYWTIEAHRVLCEITPAGVIWHVPESLSPEED
jgi:hypothetical protein